MSTPNPLQPQGVLDSAAAPKSRVRITVLTILALHVVFIGGLLLQGCDKGGQGTEAGAPETNTLSTLPPLTDTNYFTSFPGDSVAPVTTSTTPTPTPASPSIPAPEPYTSSSAVLPPPVTSSTSGMGAYGGGYTAPEPSIPASQPTGANSEHVIQKGDTIGDMAKKYGVSVQAILDANPGVQPRRLRINDRLVIPPPSPTRSSAVVEEPLPPGAESYLVKRGDNLTTIARKFGVTVRSLREANNIRGDRIVPKQRLVIPAKAGTTAGGNNPAF